MLLPEITDRLSRLLRIDRSHLLSNEVIPIEPRPLSETELNWVEAVFKASPGWENADISQTKVVALGPESEGISFYFRAPKPEIPDAKIAQNSYANIWIETSNRLIINVQIFEYAGRLQHLYVLIVDIKHPRRLIRALPEHWVEVSREVVGFS